MDEPDQNDPRYEARLSGWGYMGVTIHHSGRLLAKDDDDAIRAAALWARAHLRGWVKKELRLVVTRDGAQIEETQMEAKLNAPRS